MEFADVDAWIAWIEGDFEEAEDEAFEADDAERLVALYDEAWASYPGEVDEDLQGFVSSVMAQLHDVAAWEASARWLPRFEQLYGADDPSVRFRRGVIAWNTGDRAAGQRILADLYAEFSGSAFLADPSYVKIAKKGVAEDGRESTPDAASAPERALSLDDERVQEVVDALNRAMDEERFNEATGLAEQGLALLGDERVADGAMWFLAMLGDAQFEQEQWSDAADTFRRATQAPGGMQNPFVQVRLGQCELELGNERPAANALIAAHMMAPEILDEVPDKYRGFLEEQGLLDARE